MKQESRVMSEIMVIQADEEHSTGIAARMDDAFKEGYETMVPLKFHKCDCCGGYYSTILKKENQQPEQQEI